MNILLPRVDGVEQKPQVLLEREIAVGARFSRDGHYVAYDSSQTGQWEVYIRSYPERSSQMTVSVGGGTEPVWAQNGDIFYRSLTRERMFAVAVTTAPKLKVGTPVQLFQGSYYVSPSGSPTPQYDVSADGQRLLMLTDAATTPSRIVVVQNWTEEIKRLVPVR